MLSPPPPDSCFYLSRCVSLTRNGEALSNIKVVLNLKFLKSFHIFLCSCSGNCNRASHFKIMLSAVFFFFIFPVWSLLLLFFFKRHLCSLFHCFMSFVFNFSSTIFFFSFCWKSALMIFFVVLCEQFLIFCMAVSLLFIYLFFCYLYICLSPMFFALMVLSTVLPPYSLMLFSMANWAPQPTVLFPTPPHPASSSFLLPLVSLASGVNCTVKTYQTGCLSHKMRKHVYEKWLWRLKPNK